MKNVRSLFILYYSQNKYPIDTNSEFMKNNIDFVY